MLTPEGFDLLRPAMLVLAVLVGAFLVAAQLGGRATEPDAPGGPPPGAGVDSPRVELGGPPADERRLSRVASLIAGREVRIVCQGERGQRGEAHVPEGWAELSLALCRDLAQFVRTGPTAADWACMAVNERPVCPGIVSQQIWAVHALAHEAVHLGGVFPEAEADCLAVQHFEEAALALGTRADLAQVLADYYWAHFAAIRRPTASYWSGEHCRDGGRYDIRPDDPRWPS